MAAKEAARAADNAQLLMEEADARKKAEQQVLQLRKELEAMRENALSGDAREKEIERQHMEKLEKERKLACSISVRSVSSA